VTRQPLAPRAQDALVPPAATAVCVAGIGFVGDPAGALYWPEQGLLAVADLHLEKGSSFAARGVLLPPYDTAATLGQLGRLVARYAPRLVVALGDSFHDPEGPARIAATDRATLQALQRGREWIWIAGNHDPDPPEGVGGSCVRELACGPILFRHAPHPRDVDGEIAGHLHPVARVAQRGRTTSRRCFASDARRLVMPAFGAYTGGLNVRDRAFAEVFGTLAFTAHMLGENRLYAIAAARCLAD
jgi:DNA ligase-associated metallophosphoesterase